MPGLTLPPSQQINMDTSLGPNHNRRGGNAISDIIFDSRSSYQPSANHYPQYPYRSSSPPQTQTQPQTQPQPQLAYYYHPQQQRMFSYFALPPQGPNSWNASGPIIQPMHIPPPPPQPPTRPPRSQHKVWILDCKGCETFLTNRGMKVRKPPYSALTPSQPLLTILCYFRSCRPCYYSVQKYRSILQMHFR